MLDKVIEVLKETVDITSLDQLSTCKYSKFNSMTNSTYLVSIDGEEDIVVRIPGEGSGDYLNRSTESYLLSIDAVRQVTPEIIYHDPTTHLLITKYCKGYDHLNASMDYSEVVRMLAKLHKESKAEVFDEKYWMDSEVELGRFLAILDREDYMPEELGKNFDYTKKLIARYRNHPTNTVVCHRDLMFENILVNPNDNDDVYIIDWEYGGFDTFYSDLVSLYAEHVMRFGSDEDVLEHILTTYEEASSLSVDREEFWARYAIIEIVWSAWACVRYVQTNDQEMLDYALERASNGDKLLRRYQEYYEN